MHYIYLLINPIGWLVDKAKDQIATFFFTILLWLNAIIYSFISFLYQIFLVLARSNSLFDERIINDFINRLYLILGVIVLFLVAYSLLKAMVNPDEALKGKKSAVTIIRDVIISVVLIAFVPTIFEFALGFQNALLNYNTIGKLIAGNTTNDSDTTNTIRDGGYNMSAGVWQAFIYPDEGYCRTLDEEASNQCEVLQVGDSDITYGGLWQSAKDNTTFYNMAMLAPLISEGKVTYLFILDIVAGVFVLFVMLSYCLDMALRIVKLSVYQLIAPIPILARIIPHEQASKIFNNWVKATLSTFAEVFIRIAILYFGVILIAEVGRSIDDVFTGAFTGSASIMIETIAEALIILGIIMFIRQAPEIIKEITGLDSSKYNPLKSAKQGFSLIAGGIAGGSPLAAYRAWEQAGQAKDLLDFSAIGNQYKRREAKREAKLQGAKMSDRIGDAMRKRFGFETKLERANRMLERGLDMDGAAHEFKNDAEDAIFGGYERDANGNFIMEDVKDANGNIVYEKNADGTDRLDANGNRIAKQQKKKKTIIGKDASAPLTEELRTQLQNEKDQLAIYQSEVDEKIRQIKDGQGLDQKYIDLRGKIKKKALEKINEGHNHIKRDLTYSFLKADGSTETKSLGEMNYAAMLAYKQSRINDGASAQEISALEQVIKQNEDKMWVQYSNWAIEHDKGGEISTWYDQAVQYHDETGIYDAKTKSLFRYDRADLQTQMQEVSYTDSRDGDIHNNMAIFESTSIKLVDKNGAALTDASGAQRTARGFDKCAKANANEADTQIQHEEISKIEFKDNVARIDRFLKQSEESKTLQKSSKEYMRYKASDNANKINDSGKK